MLAHDDREKEPMIPSKDKVAVTTADFPNYGSQEYWEARYQRHLVEKSAVQESSTDTASNEDDAYHAWYFTYQELRPLIMPLILGDADEEGQVEGGKDETENRNADEGEVLIAEQGACSEGTTSEESNDGEVVESEELSDDDEEATLRLGLARSGPISVLEIGCGDVPLGAGLADDLLQLRVETPLDSSGPMSLVQKIICVDYSQVVVQRMQRLYARLAAGKSDPRHVDDCCDFKKRKVEPLVPLEFATVDARNMPYADKSMDLILEKGTLDAMLSDENEGKKNCIETIRECARVLAHGGYIMLISHINAHTTSGISWLEDVVFPGLKRGGADATWEIEVHGNSEMPEAEEGEERKTPPGGSPGPAVYIIHKFVQEKAADAEPTTAGSSASNATISVKFFSY